MSANPEVAGGPAMLANADCPDSKRPRMTVGQAFDPRKNALNAWRLALAMGVILWHSFPLTGRHLPYAVHQLLSQVWVDGFFAISGFLITASWLGNPRLRVYFLARCLRILPGLWACLVVTAFVIAPIGVAIQGGSAAKLLLSTAPIEYVVKNSDVWLNQMDIGGTPHGIPHSGMWDGSLWTLQWEVLCYISVAALGLVGLLSCRWVFHVAMALALSWAALVSYPVFEEANIPQNAARFAVMFVAGAFICRFQHMIPARWSLVMVSVAIVLAASLLPDYRLVAAFPVAYAIIVSGALIHHKWFRLRTDLSYGVYIYACPVQQVLVMGGLGSINVAAFTAISATLTLPLAALSWFAIEKPAMSLKSRLKRKRSVATS